MSKQTINLGTPNGKNGDPLRTAFSKVNQNFTELYALTGGSVDALTELAQDYAADMFVNGNHSGLTATYNDSENKLNLILNMNIDGGTASTVYDAADLTIDGGGA
jgi:hypothetical protein